MERSNSLEIEAFVGGHRQKPINNKVVLHTTSIVTVVSTSLQFVRCTCSVALNAYTNYMAALVDMVKMTW